MKRGIIFALVLLLLVGCGDQKAKDRARQADAEAELSQARSDAYQAKQQADALATQAAVNAEGQQMAMSALATQAAIVSQFTDQTLNANPDAGTGDGGGLDLVGLAPWLAGGLTLAFSFGSLVVSLLASQRKPQTEMVYVVDGQAERALLTGPQPAYLRPLPPGESRARLLRPGGE